MEVRRLMARVFTILIPTWVSKAVKKTTNNKENRYKIHPNTEVA